MNINVFKSIKKKIKIKNHGLTIAVVCLSLSLCVNSGFVYKAVRHQNTIIVPPELTKPIRFVNGVVHQDYIKDMCRWVCMLAFNFSPATARDQFADLLSLYLPDYYHQAKKTWYDLAKRIEQAGAARSFFITKILVGEAKAIIVGRQTSYANGVAPKVVKKTYIVEYKTDNGRFLIKTIMEQT